MTNQCYTKDVYAAEENVLGSYECYSTPHRQPKSGYTINRLNGSMAVAVNTTRVLIRVSTDGNDIPLSVESSRGDDASLPSLRHEYQDTSAKDNSHTKDDSQDNGDYHAPDIYQGKNEYSGNDNYGKQRL